MVESSILGRVQPLTRAQSQKGGEMLHYAIVFFVIALIAAVLGFRGVAGLSAEIGWLFAVLAVIIVAVALISGAPPPSP